MINKSFVDIVAAVWSLSIERSVLFVFVYFPYACKYKDLGYNNNYPPIFNANFLVKPMKMVSKDCK